jgi:hypothetical protein
MSEDPSDAKFLADKARSIGLETAFAVPGLVTPNGDLYHPSYGCTKRELFAAMAMQGMLACDRCSDTKAAEQAVIYADALLKELAK